MLHAAASLSGQSPVRHSPQGVNTLICLSAGMQPSDRPMNTGPRLSVKFNGLPERPVQTPLTLFDFYSYFAQNFLL